MTIKRAIENSPSPDYIKERLEYNPVTGVLTWKYHKDLGKNINRLAGREAGNIGKRDGYRTLAIRNKQYKAHILAYVIYTGKWPTEVLDHKNRIRSDNRWDNLRLSSNYFNSLNKADKHNKTGVTGVWFNPKSNKFDARITHSKGKTERLGSFSTLEEAKDAREKAKKIYHCLEHL